MRWHSRTNGTPRRLTQFILLFVFCSFSTSKLRTPIYAGLLLDQTWNISNVNSFSYHYIHTVPWPTHNQGFSNLVVKGCSELSQYRIISLVGPEHGLVSGLGYLIAQHVLIPYIGVGIQASNTRGPNHISVGPSRFAKTAAVVGLAVELGSPCIAVFTRMNTNPALTTWKLKHIANSMTVNLKIHEIHISQTQTGSEFLQISKEILVLNKSGACVVVLDCGDTLAAFIQNATATLGIPLEKFFWIMFNEEMHSEQSQMPRALTGILKLCPAFTLEDLISDAMKLLNVTLDSQEWTFNFTKGNTSCVGPMIPWFDTEKLFSSMISQTFTGKSGTVRFSSDGERRSIPYKILRKTSGNRWEHVGTAVDTSIHLNSEFWKVDASIASSYVIRMATVADDPVVMVSKDVLRPNERCTLSQLCISYKRIPIRGTNRTRVHKIRKCCVGYVIDILDLIKNDLGIHVELYFAEDGYYGAYNATTKTWNGMIGDLLQHKAEVAFTTITINEVRSHVIDFSVPFLHGETKIMLGRKKETLNVIEFGFLAPFDKYLWIAGLAAINLVLVVVWLTDHTSPFGHYRSNRGRQKYVFNFPACMSFIWSGVFKLELDCNASPRSTSARTTSAVFAFAMLMLVSSYTANLAASLVVTHDIQVTTIRDKQFVDPSSGFKFATVKSSSSEIVFTRSKDPVFQQIYKNMIPHQVQSYSEAEHKLQSGELEAFIDDSPFMDFLASRQPDCSFRIVGNPISENSYGFAFRKESKWKAPITQLILKYKRRDLFDRLRKKWFKGVCASKNKVSNQAYKMEFKHFSGLFLACLASMITCFLLLIIEHFFYRFNRKILTTYSLDSSRNSVRDMMQGNSMVRINKLRHRKPTGSPIRLSFSTPSNSSNHTT